MKGFKRIFMDGLVLVCNRSYLSSLYWFATGTVDHHWRWFITSASFKLAGLQPLPSFPTGDGL